MSIGCRDIHRPVASATHIGGAAFFEDLIGANFVAEIVPLSILGDDLIAELVVQSGRSKIALFLGYPLLQTHMRSDDKLRPSGHRCGLFAYCIPVSAFRRAVALHAALKYNTDSGFAP